MKRINNICLQQITIKMTFNNKTMLQHHYYFKYATNKPELLFFFNFPEINWLRFSFSRSNSLELLFVQKSHKKCFMSKPNMTVKIVEFIKEIVVISCKCHIQMRRHKIHVRPSQSRVTNAI